MLNRFESRHVNWVITVLNERSERSGKQVFEGEFRSCGPSRPQANSASANEVWIPSEWANTCAFSKKYCTSSFCHEPTSWKAWLSCPSVSTAVTNMYLCMIRMQWNLVRIPCQNLSSTDRFAFWLSDPQKCHENQWTHFHFPRALCISDHSDVRETLVDGRHEFAFAFDLPVG